MLGNQVICLTGTNLVSKISQGVLSLQGSLCSYCRIELHFYTLGKSPFKLPSKC